MLNGCLVGRVRYDGDECGCFGGIDVGDWFVEVVVRCSFEVVVVVVEVDDVVVEG